MNYYESNLKALNQRFPGIIPSVEKSEASENKLVSARNGSLTIMKDGVYLHSRHYPEREAEKLIDREIDDSTAFCLFYGFGLGYHIEAFQKKYPETLFAVIEPDTALFRQALSCRDYTELFHSDSWNLLLGSEAEAVTVLLDRIKTDKIQSFLLRPLYLSNREYYDKLDKIVRDYISRREINANTHQRFSRLWISNISRNAFLLSRAAGVYNLKDIFGGKPALLIAAGPGLDRVLPLLPLLRERLLLVCVDTALRACLNTGIEPDFTVLTDPQYWNARHLDRCTLRKSILVSDVSTYPTVFRQSEGPLFFCSTPFPLGEYLEKRTEIKGKLRSGGSVATAAWDLIRLMGCPRIYCAGLDLSFPEKQTHYKGSTFEERVHTLCGRFNTGETAGWQALYSGLPYLSEDYRGRPLLTDQRMKIYISWFEKQMDSYPEVHSFNLSGRGVRLEGMPEEQLESLLRLPPIRKELDHIILRISRIEAGTGEEQVRLAMGELISELKELAALTSRGVDYSRRMEETGIDPVLLEKLSALDSEILSLGGREIAGFFLLPLLEDFLAGSHKKKQPGEILKQSGEFYRALNESLEFHIRQLNRN